MSFILNIPLNEIWGSLAIALLVLEVLLGGGTVLLFIASISSFLVFASLFFNIATQESIVSQLMVFFASFCSLSIVSWRNLKIILNKQQNGYNNVVGQMAVICNTPLYPTSIGYIKWSGTICRAKLSSDSTVEKLDIGDTVVITAVEKNVFIVK